MHATERTGAPRKPRRIHPVWRTSLVADADVAIGRLLGRDLLPEGFGVKVEYTGQAVLDHVSGDRPDAVILGSDLPDMTALDLVGRLNAKPGPPLLVLLEAHEGNMVQVLDAGADDCMRKPILVGELAARLRKLVRRHLQNQGVPTVIRTETLELDCVLWRARVRGAEVRLSAKETVALRMLVEGMGNVVSHRDTLARLWGSPNLSPSGRIGSIVRNLRQKIGADGGGYSPITGRTPGRLQAGCAGRPRLRARASGGMNDRDGRPSPDALLHALPREGRGRLKIFLGAAPGVGKTFEMLTVAQARRHEGLDVVIGLVETHGRKETLALVDGLEIIPRRTVEYRGHTVEEMDLDAILARRPKLVLVDELAHTNAPGSRHPKRYLDVEELLAAGIDVFTTLNIQHVESLNDVVAGITRIRVRETVPDSIIDRADDIEIIDLTPQDLIQRLKDGKIYIAHQAERAVKHYFLPGNLAALRELALRRTAQRVDDQMVDYMRSNSISGPWGASDRVLVHVDGGPGSVALVRHARRIADGLRGPWTAIHVEGGGWREQARQTGTAEAMRLAERLGGETVTVPGADTATAVVEYARTNNFTHIIVAPSRRAHWTEIFLGSMAQRVIAKAGSIHVHVLAGDHASEAAETSTLRLRPPTLGAWGGSVLSVAVALGLAMLLRQVLGVTSVALVLLMGVLASAVAYGLAASLVACLLSVMAYNFFFLPPLYTFTISDPENVVTLSVFAVVAVVASNLTARMRVQTVTAQGRAKTTEELYQFSRKLAGAVSLDDVLWATVHQVALDAEGPGGNAASW